MIATHLCIIICRRNMNFILFFKMYHVSKSNVNEIRMYDSETIVSLQN